MNDTLSQMDAFDCLVEMWLIRNRKYDEREQSRTAIYLGRSLYGNDDYSIPEMERCGLSDLAQ